MLPVDRAAISALLPAAGRSARLGQNKQLQTYGDEPLVRRAVRQVLATGVRDVMVVTGFDAAAVTKALVGLPCTLVHHAAWEAGLGSSLAEGARACLAPGPRSLLVVLPDQALVTTRHLSALLDRGVCGEALVATRYGDVVGVPALFPADVAAELTQLTADVGARAVLKKHHARVVTLDFASAAFDLDTPQDLAALRQLDSARM